MDETKELENTLDEMPGYSNTRPEAPLKQVDMVDLFKGREAVMRTTREGRSGESPAVAEASGTADGPSDLYDRIAAEGGPLVEPDPEDDDHRLLTFLYKGTSDTSKVRVLGQLRHAGLMLSGHDDHEHPMTRIGDSDIWSLTIRARRDLRTSYTIHAQDSAEELPFWEYRLDAVPDPINPKIYGNEVSEPSRVVGQSRSASVLELDQAVHRGIGGKGPRQKWTMHWFRSELTDSTRRIWTWQPDAAPRGVLLLHDGYDCAQCTRIAEILTELTDAGELPPLLVVAVEALRGISVEELGCNDPFTDMVVTEILPWIREHWDVPADPDRLIISGQSWGGLNVVYTALRHPEAVHNVISQSGSFWYSPTSDPDGYGEYGWLIERFRDIDLEPHRLHLQVGALEGHMVTVSRHMRDILMMTGHEVTYDETNHDHSWVGWQYSIIDPLIDMTSDW
ncbi:MAG TPA: DUF3327 domain-containing protein [Candidatus Corynebacterium avicola]|uniref:DUF3327 domain-containing protein n=1 Tax=Candidatus Corynebacterium avicola TaxID=2838527 RepID=A0A9D1RM76_9CORY|nr:DUF3327 domain-containing protein [Candidatus Corynebacterium avicola]